MCLTLTSAHEGSVAYRLGRRSPITSFASRWLMSRGGSQSLTLVSLGGEEGSTSCPYPLKQASTGSMDEVPISPSSGSVPSITDPQAASYLLKAYLCKVLQ